MKTMTLRNLPDEVSAYRSGRAATEGKSINATAVSLLSRAAGLDPHQRKRRDLSWLAGSWTAAEARRFDSVVAECRKVGSGELK